MDVYSLLLEIIQRFADIILAPIKNLDLLWIIVPIYLAWFATEYFQEKKETSFGNAATNGAIMVWVSLDWLRQMITRTEFVYSGKSYLKVGIAIVFLLYGLFIMYEAIRGKPVAKHFGRIKDISYFQVTMTPVIYGVVPLDWTTLSAILVFYPVVKLLTLIMDKILPEPPFEREESTKPQDYEYTLSKTSLDSKVDASQATYQQQGYYNYNYKNLYNQWRNW